MYCVSRCTTPVASSSAITSSTVTATLAGISSVNFQPRKRRRRPAKRFRWTSSSGDEKRGRHTVQQDWWRNVVLCHSLQSIQRTLWHAEWLGRRDRRRVLPHGRQESCQRSATRTTTAVHRSTSTSAVLGGLRRVVGMQRRHYRTHQQSSAQVCYLFLHKYCLFVIEIDFGAFLPCFTVNELK